MNTEILWCERGEHNWERVIQRGKKPKMCPKHHQEFIEENKPAANGKAKTQKKLRKSSSKVFDEIKKQPGFNQCKCGLEPNMSLVDLRRLDAGCTSPQYVCPYLDSYRRRLEK